MLMLRYFLSVRETYPTNTRMKATSERPAPIEGRTTLLPEANKVATKKPIAKKAQINSKTIKNFIVVLFY